MALWDFDAIKSYVRTLTQKKGAALSNTDLENSINRYLYYTFPLEVQPNELMSWYEFTTVADDEDYSFDDTAGIILQAPAYINDNLANLYYDPQSFYNKFPQGQTYTSAIPTDILFYNDELLLRVPPDDAYTVKIKSIVRPALLSAGTDTPEREEWGPIIAYGTAIELLIASRDLDGAQILSGRYEYHKSTVQQRAVQQMYSGRVLGSV